MTNPRYDGADVAPAMRLRTHGGYRRFPSRLVCTREARAGRAAAMPAHVDDAAYAICDGGRSAFERSIRLSLG